MSGKTGFREIAVYKVQNAYSPDKELLKQLRELKISRKFIDSMKTDAVNCPMVGGESPAVKCLACPYFLRRVKGVVHCRFGIA